MVSAGISIQRKTDPQIIENGTLTAASYVNEILKAHVRPYAGAFEPSSFSWTITPVLIESMSPIYTVKGKLLLELSGLPDLIEHDGV